MLALPTDTVAVGVDSDHRHTISTVLDGEIVAP